MPVTRGVFSLRDVVAVGPEIWGDAGKQEVGTAWTFTTRLTWDKVLNSLNFSSLIQKVVLLTCSSQSFKEYMKLQNA